MLKNYDFQCMDDMLRIGTLGCCLVPRRAFGQLKSKIMKSYLNTQIEQLT